MKSARNIFITGGMGGIGKSCVEKFVDQGDQVVFTYAEENQIKLRQKNMQHLWVSLPLQLLSICQIQLQFEVH